MPYIKLSRSALLLLPSILFITGCRSAYNYFEKGDTAFARGKYAEASLDYRKAAQKDPAFGDAYYKAGLAELQQNEAAQALQDLQTAVRLMPDNQAAKTELTNLMLGAYVGDPKRPKFLYDLLVRLSSEWLKRDPNSARFAHQGIPGNAGAAAGRSGGAVPPRASSGSPGRKNHGWPAGCAVPRQ